MRRFQKERSPLGQARLTVENCLKIGLPTEASVLWAGIFLRNEVSTEKADNLTSWILAETRVAPEVVLIGQA